MEFAHAPGGRPHLRKSLDFLLVNQLDATMKRMIHNHPSGDPSPSSADVRMTREISDIAKPLGIVLHDHIIIGKSGHASLRGLKLL